MKPTGTPNDNALFVNIEGFYRVGGHAGKAGAALQENQPEAKPDDKTEKKPEQRSRKPRPSRKNDHDETTTSTK